MKPLVLAKSSEFEVIASGKTPAMLKHHKLSKGVMLSKIDLQADTPEYNNRAKSLK